MDDSFVAMEKNVCPICGEIHSHNTGILLNKRLRNIKEENTVTGYGLCEKHDNMQKEFICLIGCNNTANGNTMTFEKADRTGEILHLRRSAFPNVFNSECPDLPFIFCESEVIKMLTNSEGNNNGQGNVS